MLIFISPTSSVSTVETENSSKRAEEISVSDNTEAVGRHRLCSLFKILIALCLCFNE
uniref:Uncharacterized protein n=1 Tax=Medicago truncatula TaxID=3880 RepID=I3SCL6_MEDTR|nr:unknown [Medicago truncatula]